MPSPHLLSMDFRWAARFLNSISIINQQQLSTPKTSIKLLVDVELDEWYRDKQIDIHIGSHLLENRHNVPSDSGHHDNKAAKATA